MKNHEARFTNDTGDQDNSGVGFEVKRMLPKADYKISRESIRQEHNRPIVALLTDGNKIFRVFDLREPNDDFNRANNQPKTFAGMNCSAETAFIVLDENFEPNSDRPVGYKTVTYGHVVRIGKETENGRRFYQPEDPDSLFSVTHSSQDDSLVISVDHGKIGLATVEDPVVIKDPAYESYINKLTNNLRGVLLREWLDEFSSVDNDLAGVVIDKFSNLDEEARPIWIALSREYVDPKGIDNIEITQLINALYNSRKAFDESI